MQGRGLVELRPDAAAELVVEAFGLSGAGDFGFGRPLSGDDSVNTRASSGASRIWR
jgi:hypothetical protein